MSLTQLCHLTGKCACRYLYQHEYNLSLVDLVDRIATPHVKKYLEAMTFKSLNAYPTPKDYAEILDSCEVPLAARTSSYVSDRAVALTCPCMRHCRAWTQDQSSDQQRTSLIGIPEGRLNAEASDMQR